jgi:hypothetical protein
VRSSDRLDCPCWATILKGGKMKIKGITKQDNGCYTIIYDDCVIMSKTDVTSPTDRLTDEEQLRADLCEYIVKLKAELKRWKDVSPDRTNLEYVISLENSNKELDTQVENMKCESKLLENILNYVCSVPTRQRRAIWDDINKVCSDWQSEKLTADKVKDIIAEKDKRIAELEAKIKKMEYWWEE